MNAIPVLVDGPADAAGTVVLAHGAGAGMDSPFLRDLAVGMAAEGLRVMRFEFPYQQEARAGRPRAPDRLPVLQAALRAVVAANADAGRCVLAGKSMGGRVATTVADDLGAAGVVVFGYPFHPPRRPAQHRTAHLAALRTPTLILQGERDLFGTRDEVAGYPLSPAIRVQWFADGDHSLVPRKRSGHSAARHFAEALAAAVAFARTVLP